MATVALISFGLLLFVALEQVLAVAMFVRYCRTSAPAAESTYQPEVLVILPVRGADNTLADCIEALARQDYDNYRVRVVLDSLTDPGWRVIDQVLVTQPGLPIEVVELREPHPECSLKCSSVYQATEQLDDCEVVALLDSDIVPHDSWLSELVAPLADEQVGAATGNRWYLPQRCQLGSLLRYFWNAAAVVTMQMWGMPWGGTLAIKRSVLEGTDLRERWRRAGCEDVPLVRSLKQLGLQIRFVKSLIMIDRDEVRMGDCLRFLDRQLLWVRLYYPSCWWVCNVWQVLVASCIVTAGVVGLAGLFVGEPELFAGAVAVLGLSACVSIAVVRWVERTLLPRERSPIAQNPWRMIGAITFTNIAMVRVVFVSLLTRTIHWRGIVYRIAGPWRIRLLEYHPYVDESPTAPEPDLAGVQSLR